MTVHKRNETERGELGKKDHLGEGETKKRGRGQKGNG